MSTQKHISSGQEKEKSTKEIKGKSFEEKSKNLRKEASEIALSAEAKSNTADIIDSIPVSDKISEVTSEDKKRKSEPGRKAKNTGQSNDEEILDLKIEELKIPSQKMMIRKVRIALQKEIQETKKKVKYLEHHSTTKAFELSQTVDLLRKLYRMLQEIIYKSPEAVKNIWIHIMQKKSVSEILK